MGLSAAGVAHDDHSLIQRAIDLHQHVHFYLSKMDGSSANCIASSDFSLGFCIIVGIFVYIYIIIYIYLYIYIQYIYIYIHTCMYISSIYIYCIYIYIYISSIYIYMGFIELFSPFCRTWLKPASRCGLGMQHCDCSGCIDYRRVHGRSQRSHVVGPWALHMGQGPARRGSDGCWEAGRCWNMLDPKFRVIGDIAQDHVRHFRHFIHSFTHMHIVWFFMLLFLDA
jgi:hypothetical protein